MYDEYLRVLSIVAVGYQSDGQDLSTTLEYKHYKQTCRSLGLLEGPLGYLLHPLFLLSLPMGSCALVMSMYLTISIR